MSENLSNTLIRALEPLVGVWEHAEDILKMIYSGSVGTEEMKELIDILVKSTDKVKTDEDFIKMAIAFEDIRMKKVEEDIEKEASQKNLQELLAFDVIY